jgi:hypothetical protein
LPTSLPTAPAACPALAPTSAPPPTPQAIAARAGHRVCGHAEAGRSALLRRPTSLSTSELGHEIEHADACGRECSASTRSWARCPAALAATGSRRGFAAGWRGCRDVPALLLGGGPRLGKVTRCARCLPAPAALGMPAILEALSPTVARPIEAHHAACRPQSTLSPPARPPSQVSNRRSF